LYASRLDDYSVTTERVKTMGLSELKSLQDKLKIDLKMVEDEIHEREEQERLNERAAYEIFASEYNTVRPESNSPRAKSPATISDRSLARKIAADEFSTNPPLRRPTSQQQPIVIEDDDDRPIYQPYTYRQAAETLTEDELYALQLVDEDVAAQERIATSNHLPTFEQIYRRPSRRSPPRTFGRVSRGSPDRQPDVDNMSYEQLMELGERIGNVATGLSKDQIYRLGSAVHRGPNQNCTVCMDDIEAGQAVKYLPCLHNYHEGCIVKWLENKKTCPVCQKDASA